MNVSITKSEIFLQREVEKWKNRLAEITDPELPFISIKDLGVLRRVSGEYSKDSKGKIRMKVTLTPTFSGCPAMFEIRQRVEVVIQELLKEFPESIDYQLVTELIPPWNSRSISDEGKKCLVENGIAVEDDGIHCPQCGSDRIEVISQFGSTACKKFARCLSCREPFETFKSLS